MDAILTPRIRIPGRGGRRLRRRAERRAAGRDAFGESRRYTLAFGGLALAGGGIRSATLETVLANLRRAADRVVRFRALCVGVTTSGRPAWLRRTVDFTVTGFGVGDATVGLRAPCLRETAAAVFGAASPGNPSPTTNPDDTALDLLSETIRVLSDRDRKSFPADHSVVEAIMAFDRAVGKGVRCSLRKEGAEDGGFESDALRRFFRGARAEDRRTGFPRSRAFVVSGVMDRIRRETGRFRLRLPDGRTLACRLDRKSLETETLRKFRGRPATVTGLVHFHPDGRPRVLVARRLHARRKTDSLYEHLPWGGVPGLPVMNPEVEKKAREFDWSRLKGLWKIELSTEEILEQIRELRRDP